MNISILHIKSFILPHLTLIAVLILFATTAVADFKQDAESAAARLHQNGAARKFPDDMRSLDLVIEVAQRYVLSDKADAAEKFYQLALQKSRIIESMINGAEAVPLTVKADGQPLQGANPQVETMEAETTSEPVSDRIVGAKGVYTAVKADNIRLVAAKLGVTQQHLRTVNALEAKAYLKVGQKLVYNNRKIIPQHLKDGIIINIPDRTLYYFRRGALVASLPVAVGSKTKNEKYVWQTPVGKFKITGKVKNPTWTVPPSIQTEMEENGKDVVMAVPPGPENPLGQYAIKTSIPGILIHSTTRPSSIYSFSSHGCIRLSPDMMEELFPKIKVNTRGEIIYKPVKLAVTDEGRVFLEVHHDVYKKSSNLVAEARQLVEKLELSERVDWEKFKAVLKQKNGIAEDISL